MNNDMILLGHGSGGKLSHQLLDDLIIPLLSGVAPDAQDDAALLDLPPGRPVFTTDSYVVDPIIFPGGNIGTLAVNGTINDLAMMGARPVALSVGLIIEEGMSRQELAEILASMGEAATAAGVRIVTGDTKVVPRGKADRLFINTSGIGVLEPGVTIRGNNARPGDRVLINGTIGDHGIAVMAQREGLALSAPIVSDCAPLHTLAADLLRAAGPALHVLRDPTRGGVATTLKEIARQSGVDLTLQEEALPVARPVAGVCAILGLDPLYVANEGKLLAFVAPDAVDAALEAMHRHPLGRGATVIGEVTEGDGRVRLRTLVGGTRMVEMLAGEQLPRIC